MSAPTPIELLPAFFAASAALSASRSTTTTCAPLSANSFAVAAPIAPAPPVTSTTWPVSGFGLLEASLACSSDQYSSANRSALDSGWKLPTASAPRTASIHISPTSDAILASFSVRPWPNMPRPGTSVRRGIGSSMVRLTSSQRVVGVEIGAVVVGEVVDMPADDGLVVAEPCRRRARAAPSARS